jgi:uncharacterized protein (TIGR02271 family)
MTEQAVVGVFDSSSTATQVREELIRRGILPSNITVDTRTGDSTGTTVGESYDRDHDGGGITGFFRSLFGDDGDQHSSGYGDALRRGSVVVMAQVSSDAEVSEAKAVMQQFNPIDVDTQSTGEQLTGERTGTELRGMPDTNLRNTEATQRIPVIQEEIAVGKRQVQRGAVRVYTRVQETPIEESVTLREEHARVERHSVDRVATEADLQAVRDGETIEIVETAEEPVVSKRARVVEEVEIGTGSTERTETVRDTVRRTDVEVDSSDSPAAVTGSTRASNRNRAR